MRRTILTALGVLTAIAGLASSVQAQPTEASNSETGEFTSGGSLGGIRNRSVQNDFNRFFLDNSAAPAPARAGTVPNNTEINDTFTPRQQLGVLQISDDVQLISNDPLYAPTVRVPGQENQPFNNIERVRVQVDVGQ
ncbi:MAG: hypothetical protein AB1589_07750 [Cyanobacteriota bacterium]